jgi:hypothetical protein
VTQVFCMMVFAHLTSAAARERGRVSGTNTSGPINTLLPAVQSPGAWEHVFGNKYMDSPETRRTTRYPGRVTTDT